MKQGKKISSNIVLYCKKAIKQVCLTRAGYRLVVTFLEYSSRCVVKSSCKDQHVSSCIGE